MNYSVIWHIMTNKKLNQKTQSGSSSKSRGLAEEPAVPYISWDLSHAVSMINRGLAVDILKIIQSRLSLTNMELSSLLMISPRTLDRRRKEDVLTPDESERSYRVARLTDLAAEIFGSIEKAEHWFKEANFALGNQKPIELMKTEPGARLVERTLRQIEYGITV